MKYLMDHPEVVELIAAILSLIYLFFSIRKSVWLWPVGLLSSLFYVVVFFFSKLYAEMGLNVYYVLVSIYGWYHWLVFKKENDGKAELPVVLVSRKEIFMYLIVFAGSFFLLFYILSHYTDSPVPGWDSLATSLSFIATWMLARKVLENWLVWIVADGLCIGIYFYKHLYFTVGLFIVYTVLAIVGYYQWKRQIPSDQKTLTA